MAHFSRRNFLSTTAAAAAGSTLLSRVSLAMPQDPVVNSKGVKKDGKPFNGEKVAWKARPFPMKNVRLGEGPCKVAMEADRQFLHSLPPDRLVHTFRINAGLPSSAQPLGGWEAPDCELRGHYAGGHYLSAAALMYASTGDEEIKKNGTAVVTELGKCQDAMKSGYLSAFPVDFFDRLRNAKEVWAPFIPSTKSWLDCSTCTFIATTSRRSRWSRKWLAGLRATPGRSATSTCSVCSELNSAAWAKCSATSTPLPAKITISKSRSVSTRKPSSILSPPIAMN